MFQQAFRVSSQTDPVAPAFSQTQMVARQSAPGTTTTLLIFLCYKASGGCASRNSTMLQKAHPIVQPGSTVKKATIPRLFRSIGTQHRGWALDVSQKGPANSRSHCFDTRVGLQTRKAGRKPNRGSCPSAQQPRIPKNASAAWPDPNPSLNQLAGKSPGHFSRLICLCYEPDVLRLIFYSKQAILLPVSSEKPISPRQSEQKQQAPMLSVRAPL